MRQAELVVAIAGMLLAGGCATIIRSDKQKLRFETEPPGATVTIGERRYTTPATVELQRKGEYTVVVSKEGCRTIKFDMRANWDGVSLLSWALPGGSIWLAMDTASGADRAFYAVPPIKLVPGDASAPPLEMRHYRGRLLSEQEYAALMEEERQQRRREFPFEK